MLDLERSDYIIQEIQEKRKVYIDSLSRKFFVSKSTIRRDLAQLEKEGYLKRFHGGAELVVTNKEIPFPTRNIENKREKEIISKYAASLVRDGMLVFMDSSSTQATLPVHIKDRTGLKVVTNSAQLALICSGHGIETYCTGGRLHKYGRGFVGEWANGHVGQYHADIMFFSSHSFSIEYGVTDINEDIVLLKKSMINHAREIAFLCDHTKFQTDSIRKVCSIRELDYVVTDKKPGQRWLKEFDRLGVEIICPER